MARIYRLGTGRQINPTDMTRFVYVLKELRACIECMRDEDIDRRLTELEHVVLRVEQP